VSEDGFVKGSDGIEGKKRMTDIVFFRVHLI
jgi:hypothetical protein